MNSIQGEVKIFEASRFDSRKQLDQTVAIYRNQFHKQGIIRGTKKDLDKLSLGPDSMVHGANIEVVKEKPKAKPKKLKKPKKK